jgi:predicted deacylase
MNKEHRTLYTTVTGNVVGYDLYTFGSGTKKLYIQGGIHGGEVTYFIFKKLYEYLRDNESRLNCQVALAPLVNPRAWEQRMYHYTAGKFDWHKGKDWNRGYAGDPESDLSARMSSVIMAVAAEYAECVDLHTARTSAPYMITTSASAKDALHDIGIPYTLYAPRATAYVGSFMHVCSERGSVSYAIECGSHDSYSESHIESVSTGLMHRIDALCMSGEQKIQKETPPQYYAESIKVLYAPVSGFTHYLHEPYAHVSQGAAVCIIAEGSDLGAESSVCVPTKCVILELSKTHTTSIGDEIVRYIPKDDLRLLDNLT